MTAQKWTLIPCSPEHKPLMVYQYPEEVSFLTIVKQVEATFEFGLGPHCAYILILNGEKGYVNMFLDFWAVEFNLRPGTDSSKAKRELLKIQADCRMTWA